MDRIKHSLEQNASILKSQVSKYAIIGLVISVIAILLATMAVGYQMTGQISLQSIIIAQSSNVALWILNLTPILFMFWGQSVSSVMSYTAGAMVLDQTNELRMQANELSSRAQHDASHDTLTDLPNRVLYMDRLNQAIHVMRGKNGHVAVIALNINNFKELNTGLGTYNADRLLKQFAQRVKNSIDDQYTVARFSADEFYILCPAIERQDEAFSLARKVQKAVAIHFALDDIILDISATAGLSMFPEHGKDTDTLIHRANFALHYARETHKDIAVYDLNMDKSSPNKLIMMSELKKAIDGEQLMMYYQPKVALNTGQIEGCEALVRWEHPTFGMMSAEKFVPVAERTGLIKSLTQYVLKQVIEDCSKMHQEGLDIHVSLNLSAVDIIDIELPYTIESLLHVHNLPAHCLTIEIIESASLTDQQRAIDVINKLAALGIRVSIDDFGTGYSSFVYLTHLPISEIKIDKSFILNLHQDDSAKTIVEAIIRFAEVMKLSIVAEGIEKITHLKILKDLNCAYGQGFFFSKAIPLGQFIELARQKKPFPLIERQDKRDDINSPDAILPKSSDQSHR